MTTTNYVTVAASQTGQVLGANGGARGDQMIGLLIAPATTSPGAVTLLDGATSITVFPGGANSASNLMPVFAPWPANSKLGVWSVTTGANVSVVAFGQFT